MSESFADPDGNEIIVIEFCSGHPCSVVTRNGDIYDLDWCRKHQQLYYHLSGAGFRELEYDAGTRRAWVAHDVKLLAGIRVKRQPKNPFDDICHGEVAYCKLCDDHLPEDEMCNHLQWVEEEGLVMGCGSEYGIQDHDGLFDLFTAMGKEQVASLYNGLRRDFHVELWDNTIRWTHGNYEHRAQLPELDYSSCAQAWMRTLEPDAKKQVVDTAFWIDAWTNGTFSEEECQTFISLKQAMKYRWPKSCRKLRSESNRLGKGDWTYRAIRMSLLGPKFRLGISLQDFDRSSRLIRKYGRQGLVDLGRLLKGIA